MLEAIIEFCGFLIMNIKIKPNSLTPQYFHVLRAKLNKYHVENEITRNSNARQYQTFYYHLFNPKIRKKETMNVISKPNKSSGP